jgi:hypothetical protein
MITGLLFTLAQKPIAAANDPKAEGRHFPPPTKPRTRQNLVSAARAVSMVLAIVGASLMVAAFSNWSFDPDVGYRIQTAGLNFTLRMGVCS